VYFVWQQVGEANEYLPFGRCPRQPSIETAIEHQILPRAVAQRPQGAHGIALKKGLREMPDFSRDPEVLSEWV
jgi:hypothetical protein